MADGDPQGGRLIPSGGDLLRALIAGCLWLLALYVMSGFPNSIRFAVLYEQRAHEGIGWFQVYVSIVLVAGLLLVASRLSGHAHGVGREAPKPVRIVRGMTWTVAVTLLVGGVIASGVAGPGCFRTCAPFPN